jgi:cation:H+ antiporter
MVTFGWIAVAAVGFMVALSASRRVANHASSLAQASRISPFVIGLVLLAVGTDVPEIANSIITSAAGHGDLNVGDSVGSTLTQMTLVLGLLPFAAGVVEMNTRSVLAVGGLIAAMLLLGVVLTGDGDFSRIDGVVLVSSWIVTMYLAVRARALDADAPDGDPEPPDGKGRVRHAAAAFGYVLVVGAGAAAAVSAMIQIAERLNVPEYAVSFFGASIGTSLPELIVAVIALRRGMAGLAIGDVLGSSLADATLSIGIGPTLFPTAVDADLVVRGGLYTALAVALTVMLLALLRRHDRRTGVVLIALYAMSYVVLLR